MRILNEAEIGSINVPRLLLQMLTVFMEYYITRRFENVVVFGSL